MKKLSKGPTDTDKIAELFLDKIIKKSTKNKGATVVGLLGDLGAGKTTFTQFVAKYLGIKNKVNSPTFVIIKKYPLKIRNYKFLIHIDAYRLKNENELLRLGWQEIINDKEHLVFIEWPENAIKAMPKNMSYIYITHRNNDERGLELK